jgi:hypothetical protein
MTCANRINSTTHQFPREKLLMAIGLRLDDLVASRAWRASARWLALAHRFLGLAGRFAALPCTPT